MVALGPRGCRCRCSRGEVYPSHDEQVCLTIPDGGTTMTKPPRTMYTAALTASLLALIATCSGGAPVKLTATDIERFAIYHSPQTPGYTCWVGTWLAPDGALRVTCHQATGPLHGRPHGARRCSPPSAGRPPACRTTT